MALGVLNNLSAIYAENNLNNTSNSLQTVLQQLSSGSRINSGADDAAGLSLVNGLAANSAALTQSETNVTEGVGLLQVADGALSQVTSLLDRAITLATEASNGTLNSTQDSAANQEYQSILSEINNIGATTTYNQEAVFSGRTMAIYTGDSSETGSSLDDLNVRTLSQASVGDSGGVMAYSNGADNVFLNLSSSTANAAIGDTLNASGTTTLDVNYLVKGASGAASTASTSITVGTGTSYANTAQGLINAINNSGLGLTATFTTQAASGVTGGGTQTGISIAGGLVSAGVDPNSSSTSGMLNAGGIPASELLTQGQTVTVSEAGTQKASVTINSTINTLSELATAINTQAGAGTATVVTNGDGSQSLALADNAANGGALTVTTTAGAGAVTPVFGGAVLGNNAEAFSVIANSSVAGTATTAATAGSVTFGTSGTNAGSDALSVGGQITIQNTIPNDPQSLTFVVGSGTDTANTFYTQATGGGTQYANTLTGLANLISAQSGTLGATAAVGTNGITVTAISSLTGENLSASGITLTNANNTLGLYSPTDGGAASAGTPQITAIDAGGTSALDDVLNTGGSITLTSASGGSYTFTATAGQTYADLALGIDGSNLGVTAAWSSTDHALLLTSTTNGPNAITASANTLSDTTISHAVAVDSGNAGSQTGTAGVPATYSTAVLQLGSGNLNDNTADITGQIELQNGSGSAYTFIMGTGSNSGTTVYTGANTVSSLVTAINATAGLDIAASAPGSGTGAIYLQSTISGTGHLITTPGTTTLASATAFAAPTTVSGVTGVTGNDASIAFGLAAGGLSTSDVLATGGTFAITNGAVTENFTIGAGAAAHTTYLAAGSTLSQLAAAITAFSPLGVTATANTSGLSIVSNATESGSITIGGSPTMADATQGSYATDTLGSVRQPERCCLRNAELLGGRLGADTHPGRQPNRGHHGELDQPVQHGRDRKPGQRQQRRGQRQADLQRRRRRRRHHRNQRHQHYGQRHHRQPELYRQAPPTTPASPQAPVTAP